MGPGVAGFEAEPIPESTSGFQLQSVVAGCPYTLDLRNAVEARVKQIVLGAKAPSNLMTENVGELRLPGVLVGLARCWSRPIRGRNEIDRHAYLQVVAASSDVRRLENYVVRSLEFHSGIPLLRARVCKVLIHRAQRPEVHLIRIEMTQSCDSLRLRRRGASN